MKVLDALGMHGAVQHQASSPAGASQSSNPTLSPVPALIFAMTSTPGERSPRRILVIVDGATPMLVANATGLIPVSLRYCSRVMMTEVAIWQYYCQLEFVCWLWNSFPVGK